VLDYFFSDTYFIGIIIPTITFTYPSQVLGKIGFITTIDSTNNNTLANLTAEAQISPYSSFVLLAYCPPASLDLSECKTLIFPVLSEQRDYTIVGSR
jgi:hypothetical protein